MLVLGCVTAEPPAGIEDRGWYLVAIGTTAVDVATEKRPTLRLDSQGARVAGFAGCNQFAGHYTLAGADEVKFGPLAVTKMYCAEAHAIEDQYLAALGSVARWTVAEDALTLSSNTDPVLRFRELTPTRRVH